jgi:hypothetical protein
MVEWRLTIPVRWGLLEVRTWEEYRPTSGVPRRDRRPSQRVCWRTTLQPQLRQFRPPSREERRTCQAISRSASMRWWHRRQPLLRRPPVLARRPPVTTALDRRNCYRADSSDGGGRLQISASAGERSDNACDVDHAHPARDRWR